MSTSPYHSPLCPPQDGGRTECWASGEMDDASARGRGGGWPGWLRGKQEGTACAGHGGVGVSVRELMHELARRVTTTESPVVLQGK